MECTCVAGNGAAAAVLSGPAGELQFVADQLMETADYPVNPTRLSCELYQVHLVCFAFLCSPGWSGHSGAAAVCRPSS
jgi:hypothetical protein